MTPKFIARSYPTARWTGAHKGHAFFAYANNYLIDTDHGVIVDVDAPRAIRKMPRWALRERWWSAPKSTRFGRKPGYLVANTAYGSPENLAWLVKPKRSTPYIPVLSRREPTARSRVQDFTFDREADCYTCPGR